MVYMVYKVFSKFTGNSEGGSISPSSMGGQFKGFVNKNTLNFPANVNDYSYVKVDPNLWDGNEFSVQGIVFASKKDQAYYLNNSWHSLPAFSNTQEVNSVDPARESISGIATTQQKINEENKKKIQDLETRSQRIVGYFSETVPTGELHEGDLWFPTNSISDIGSDLPTNFPIQVYIYLNGSWSSNTQDYTAKYGNIWSNLNNRHDFYWAYSQWTWTNSALPNLNSDNLEYNSANQITLKDNSVGTTKLATNITDNTTLTQDANTNQVKIKDNGVGIAQLDTEGIITTNQFLKINSNNKFETAQVGNNVSSNTLGMKKFKVSGGLVSECEDVNYVNGDDVNFDPSIDNTNTLMSYSAWKKEETEHWTDITSQCTIVVNSGIRVFLNGTQTRICVYCSQTTQFSASDATNLVVLPSDLTFKLPGVSLTLYMVFRGSYSGAGFDFVAFGNKIRIQSGSIQSGRSIYFAQYFNVYKVSL